MTVPPGKYQKSDGKVVRIADMNDHHLNNAIKKMEGDKALRAEKYAELTTEREHRIAAGLWTVEAGK